MREKTLVTFNKLLDLAGKEISYIEFTKAIEVAQKGLCAPHSRTSTEKVGEYEFEDLTVCANDCDEIRISIDYDYENAYEDGCFIRETIVNVRSVYNTAEDETEEEEEEVYRGLSAAIQDLYIEVLNAQAYAAYTEESQNTIEMLARIEAKAKKIYDAK